MNIGMAVSNYDWGHDPRWQKVLAACSAREDTVAKVVTTDLGADAVTFRPPIDLLITNSKAVAAKFAPVKSMTIDEAVEEMLEGTPTEPEETGGGENLTNASKTAIALAAEHEVDLTLIEGTGDAGKITKPDVQKYLDEQAPAE